MSLLSLQEISFSWSGTPLLDGIRLEIAKAQRIGLLGRNGAGKSTLLRIMAGLIEPEDGLVRQSPGLTTSLLPQEVPENASGTIERLVAGGCPEDHEDWQVDQAVQRQLSSMSLEGEIDFGSLSSGMKRRCLLARALVAQPDILFLDEPTNHLDLESIVWLEKYLKSCDTVLVFVTHDRKFLQHLATRIIEIDRGHLYDWQCDYPTFLQRKAELLEAERKQQALAEKKLAQEEAWIRQGVLARRTRNQGRVKRLQLLREEQRQRRSELGNVRLQAARAEKGGQLVLEAKDLRFSYDSGVLVERLSLMILRNEKIGIIGANGCGKTTLLKILLGELEPQSGSVRHGTRLQIAYFDQLRQQIEDEESVAENVGEGNDSITVNGSTRHILGYLQDFLFTPEQARQPAKFLSGGERHRLLLARLFKRPSNVLVLDEPTNDLDAETLDLLEELIADYQGTVLMVSHDRAFLNNVVTSTLAFEGEGKITHYYGGYDEVIRQREESTAASTPARSKTKSPRPRREPKSDRLSYHEKRELESLPQQIESLEVELQELHQQMGDPAFFKKAGSEIAVATAHSQELESNLQELYQKWEELEARRS